MLNARIFGPQQLYPAEPGWRAAFFREGDEPFEMAPVIFWALVVEEPDEEWDGGMVHSHIAPVILEDGAPSHGAMDDLDFYALFAPGEEVTDEDRRESARWAKQRGSGQRVDSLTVVEKP